MKRLHREESGQVTFLFVFASIAFVILLGFVLNTAKQTSRKIEMQGAADAAAVAGGTWMARGMNVMVLNNKGMSELLSVMIAFHATVQTADTMPRILIPIIAALMLASVEFPPLAIEARQLQMELSAYTRYAHSFGQFDRQMSGPNGFGWELMRELDRLNQLVKQAMPFVAIEQANEYAGLNGADAGAWVASGERGSKPRFPVARGNPEYIARNTDCALDRVKPWARGLLLGYCSVNAPPLCTSGLLAWPVFNRAVSSNVEELSGGDYSSAGGFLPDELKNLGEVGKVLDEYNKQHGEDEKYIPKDVTDIFKKRITYDTGSPLGWPNNPPRPMQLTDLPLTEAAAVIPDSTAAVDLGRVASKMRYLAVTLGNTKPPMIGTSLFADPMRFPYWATYAQANVYNPVAWSMFSQAWRAKLARATLLKDKLKEFPLIKELGVMPDPSYFNTH